VVVGDNEPYSGRGEQEYTIGAHAVPHDLPRVSIEIRQDLIGDEAGVHRWANVLQPAIAAALRDAGYDLAVATVLSSPRPNEVRAGAHFSIRDGCRAVHRHGPRIALRASGVTMTAR
jgi:hypothetical protein